MNLSKYITQLIVFSLSILAIIGWSDDGGRKILIVDYKNFPNNNKDNDFWSSRIKTGKPDIKAVEDEELKLKVLNIKSNLASYMFQTEVNNLNLDTHGLVNWKWKVKQHPKGGDTRDKKVDDQAAQLILAFEGRYAITYIWDPSAPPGFNKDASIPLIVSNKVVVLESGDKNLGKWVDVQRDVKADFKALYKKEAPKLKGVAFQINSQYTKTTCEAFFSPISFTAK